MPAKVITPEQQRCLVHTANVDWKAEMPRERGAVSPAFADIEQSILIRQSNYLNRDSDRSPEVDDILIANRPLFEAFERSRSILRLQDNWDDEGSLGYNIATWEKTRSFLLPQGIAFWIAHHRELAIPRIQPGPDGSIDLQWTTDNRELLINVPAAQDEPISYYGDNKVGQDVVKGILDPAADNERLWTWLMQ